MPPVGFVNAGSARGLRQKELQAYLKGLGETGYIEGQNVSIEYRWKHGNCLAQPPAQDSHHPETKN
jgi:putative tryptophan/tyrosine transport system substrate-binding protein